MHPPTRPPKGGASFAALVLLAGLLALARPSANARSVDSLAPASTGGLAALDEALDHLSSHRRLLMIAAHPDDEDTLLLTLVARGQGGDAAYLSLSRGEGGQNLIGSQLGVGLGLLRSRELEAARRIDGATQLFARAYDFGFTRSLEETLQRWPEDVLIEDTLRAIRRFRPQVLVSVFPATPAAGHGQHQAAGLVAEKAFQLSQDPDAFPELDAEGLEHWPVRSFWRTRFFNPGPDTLRLPLGHIDPFSGKSVFQTALESRSQHRCQDMGLLQPLGDAQGALAWVAGVGGPEPKDLWDGVDTDLSAIADSLKDGDLRRAIAVDLEQVEQTALAAARQLGAGTMGQSVEPLARIVALLDGIVAKLEAWGGAAGDGRVSVLALVDEKRQIAREALATAAGIAVDAFTGAETVVPGQRLAVTAQVWDSTGDRLEGAAVELASAEGWRTLSAAPGEPGRQRFFVSDVDVDRRFEVEVPADAPPTVPYFLRRPLDGDLFDWSDATEEERILPFGPPPLSATFQLRIAGVQVELEREVVHRRRDQAIGEVRRPLRVVPRLEVALERDLLVATRGRDAGDLGVRVTSNLDAPVRGHVRVTAPAPWPAPEPVPFTISEPRGSAAIDISLPFPEGLGAARHPFGVEAVLDGGARAQGRYDHAYPLVDYPHIRPVVLPTPATFEVTGGDLRMPSLERVGWVRGASDRSPEILLDAGLPLELLDADALATADLGAYDAIVVGPRAYEVSPALVRANRRLLGYVEEGGLLIVQYQQYQWSGGDLAPLPIEIHRPHGRVTDEGADVRILDPQHPVFHDPNRIGDADWHGWVQERGLYFGGTWDDAYQPLLAMADPGGDEHRGALLIADVGKGRYVYTGLAFFRQLPAGVPGAYRLFFNLLGLRPGP
ncbi:MAG: PIG-L family deacetylase [Acidobacteriota bacterium]